MANINVSYAFDKRIWREFTVSLYSLLANRGGCHYDVYIIVPDEIDDSIKREIEEFAKNTDAGSRIIWLAATYNLNASFDRRLGNMMMERLSLPRMLPDVDKIIYLDSGDTLILEPLDEFYATDFGDNYIAASVDEGFFRDPGRNRTQFDRKYHMAEKHKSGKYINSGVLLMNLKKMREENVFAEFKKVFDKFHANDQNLTNAVCADRIKILSSKFNQFSGHEPFVEGQVVYHYVWGAKPYNCLFEISEWRAIEIWWEYALKTPYAMDFIKRSIDWDVKDRKRRHSKWLIYFASMFLPKRKSRVHLRKKYARRY